MSNYPPPGGFGAQGQGQGMGPMYPNAPSPKSGMGTGAIIAIVLCVVVGGLVVIIGVFAVLGVYGTRKYIANAKTAEAKNSLGQIAKDAASAYEREEVPGSRTLGLGDSVGVSHRLCPSARSPVPSSFTSVSGMKYQSTHLDWAGDPGWSCLGFELNMPQYYQYNYASSSDSFTATAKGDINGNLVPSTFEVQGRVENGMVRISPSIMETDPEE